MAKTAIRTEQGGVATGGAAGEVYTKNSGTDFDAAFAAATGGGGFVGNLAEQFDDFTSAAPISPNGGAGFYFKSGNFMVLNTSTQDQTGFSFVSEAGADGVVQTNNNTSVVLIGFSQFDTSIQNVYLLRFDDDFDIEMRTKLTYNATFTGRYQLVGGTDNVRIDVSDTGVSYDIGAGPVATAVPVPATGVYFNVKFNYTAGVLTLTLDSDIIFSGAVVLADGFYIRIEESAFTGSSDIFVDWVRTNYRAVPAGSASLGNWSTPITPGVPYLATSAGFVVAWQGVAGGGFTASIEIKSDNLPVPVTTRQQTDTTLNGGASYVTHINAMCPVKNGDYVQVDIVNGNPTGGAVYWIPLT